MKTNTSIQLKALMTIPLICDSQGKKFVFFFSYLHFFGVSLIRFRFARPLHLRIQGIDAELLEVAVAHRREVFKLILETGNGQIMHDQFARFFFQLLSSILEIHFS